MTYQIETQNLFAQKVLELFSYLKWVRPVENKEKTPIKDIADFRKRWAAFSATLPTETDLTEDEIIAEVRAYRHEKHEATY